MPAHLQHHPPPRLARAALLAHMSVHGASAEGPAPTPPRADIQRDSHSSPASQHRRPAWRLSGSRQASPTPHPPHHEAAGSPGLPPHTTCIRHSTTGVMEARWLAAKGAACRIVPIIIRELLRTTRTTLHGTGCGEAMPRQRKGPPVSRQRRLAGRQRASDRGRHQPSDHRARGLLSAWRGRLLGVAHRARARPGALHSVPQAPPLDWSVRAPVRFVRRTQVAPGSDSDPNWRSVRVHEAEGTSRSPSHSTHWSAQLAAGRPARTR
jgi:hypothetical protein